MAIPGPDIDTAVALSVVQETVVVPGLVADVGLSPIDAVTDGSLVTVTVAVWVTGPPYPCAVIV